MRAWRKSGVLGLIIGMQILRVPTIFPTNYFHKIIFRQNLFKTPTRERHKIRGVREKLDGTGCMVLRSERKTAKAGHRKFRRAKDSLQQPGR